MCKIYYYNQKLFYLHYASYLSGYHWLHVSIRRTILLQCCDLTTIKWRFHFIRGRFHYSGSIKYCQIYMIQNSISSETHNWYVCATWEIEPKKSRFNTDDFPGRSGRSKYFAYLGTYMLFVDQPVVSLSLSHRANQWLLESEWDGQQHLTAPIWKCMPGIGDHRFTFLTYLLSNYTFYTNLTIFSVSRLLIDVTNLIVFNLWKVTQHRLMPV